MSDIHAAVGSYAVDALTPVERAEFEAHLDDCHSCRWEVAEFGETLAQLSVLTAAAPPAALRESVLATVSGVAQVGSQRRQQSADGAGTVEDQAAEAEPTPRRALAPVTELRALEPHEVVPLDEHPSEVPDEPWLGMAAVLSEDMGRLSRWQERVLGAVVAVALLVAMIMGGWAFVSRRQIETLETRAQQQTQLLNAPDAKLYRDNLEGTPVSFVVSKERNEVLFVGNDVAPPEAGSVYQLWIVRGRGSASAGVVHGGDIRELFTNGQVRRADGLLVTLEPGSRGSLSPSGPELAQVDLSS